MRNSVAILAFGLGLAAAAPVALAQDPGNANPVKTDRGRVEGAVIMPERSDTPGSDERCDTSSPERDAAERLAKAPAEKRGAQGEKR
jgi:hypothetical protein